MEPISVVGVGANLAARQADRNDKEIILKNWAPFIDCTSKINNTQLDNPKDLDVVMPMSNLIGRFA